MSTPMAVALGHVHAQDALRIAGYAVAFYIAIKVISLVYIAFFGPLSRFPGPFWNKLSSLPYAWHEGKGVNNEYMPALHAKYGPIVRYTPTALSFVGSAQVWNDIHGHRKTGGQPKPHKDPKFYHIGRLMQVDSIVTADDENHGRQRKILSHAFSAAALREQQPMLKRWAEKMKDRMAERTMKGQKLDMLKAYNCTTFDVMADLTFGEDLRMLEDGDYTPWVKTIFAGIKTATMFRALRYFAPTRFLITQLMKSKKVRQKQWDHMNWSIERVDKRMSREATKPDLWTRIIAKKEVDGGLTRDEQYVNSSLFMTAGTETTATALSGLTYYLGMNPDALQKVTEEVRTNINSFDDMSLDQLARLKYLNACLQEALRMYPPVPIILPRCVPKGGLIIGGTYVPEGAVVGIHHLSTYRSEQHFRNPYKFAPERWLGTDPEYADDNPDAWEPFSHGPRNCIGKNLAWHEMRLLAATTLLHFDVRLAEESRTWADQHVYTLWEKKPLMCTLTPAQQVA